MKTCSICKTLKGLDAFNKKTSTKDGLQCKCKDCSRQMSRQRYKANPKSERIRIDARRKLISQKFAEYKAACSCENCGESAACCLDFHHVDADEKEFTLAKAAGWGYSWKKILQEIVKCVVLCSNCHRKYHAGLIEIGKSSNGRMQVSETCHDGSSPSFPA